MEVERRWPLVLLHGAGLGSWIWTRVTPLLQVGAAAVDLPGRGGNAHPNAVRLRDCVDHLVAILLSRDEPSVVVAHSFSAQVAMLAAQEHPDRVRALVLLGAVLPEPGRPLISIFPQPGRFLLAAYIRLARAGVRLPRALARVQYGTGLDEATRDMVVDRLVPEARGLYLDPVDWTKPGPGTPVIYVTLTRDAAIAPAEQERMARRAGASRMESVPSGHLPMLSHPREVAEVLNRITAQLA